MLTNEAMEIIGVVLATLTGGGASLSINNRKKHNKLYERVAILEAKQETTNETLKDIRDDLKYIRERVDKNV